MTNALAVREEFQVAVSNAIYDASAGPLGIQNERFKENLTIMLWDAVRVSPGLQQCTPESVVSAVAKACRLGLDPNLPNEYSIVPYGKEATLMVEFGGIKRKALESPMIEDIWAHAVHENDFYEEQGIDDPPIHKRPPKFGKRGRAIGYYAVARLANGSHRVVTMSREEVEAHRDTYSKSAKGQFWTKSFDKMAIKTLIRQLCSPRVLPIGVEMAGMFETEETFKAITPGQIHNRMQHAERVTPQLAAAAADDLFGDGAGDQWREPEDIPEVPQMATKRHIGVIESYLIELGVRHGDTLALLNAVYPGNIPLKDGVQLMEDLEAADRLPLRIFAAYVKMLRERVGLTQDQVQMYIDEVFGIKIKELDTTQQFSLIAWLVDGKIEEIDEHDWVGEVDRIARLTGHEEQDIDRWLIAVYGSQDDSVVAVAQLDAMHMDELAKIPADAMTKLIDGFLAGEAEEKKDV